MVDGWVEMFKKYPIVLSVYLHSTEGMVIFVEGDFRRWYVSNDRMEIFDRLFKDCPELAGKVYVLGGKDKIRKNSFVDRVVTLGSRIYARGLNS